jgi:hypothetical protein
VPNALLEGDMEGEPLVVQQMGGGAGGAGGLRRAAALRGAALKDERLGGALRLRDGPLAPHPPMREVLHRVPPMLLAPHLSAQRREVVHVLPKAVLCGEDEAGDEVVAEGLRVVGGGGGGLRGRAGARA